MAQVDYDAVRNEVFAILRDDARLYAEPVEATLKRAVRRLLADNPLPARYEYEFDCGKGVGDMKIDADKLGIIREIYRDTGRDEDGDEPENRVWWKLKKIDMDSAQTREIEGVKGVPSCYSVYGGRVHFDRILDKIYRLRLVLSHAAQGCNELPILPAYCYDFLIHAVCFYMMAEYLNRDGSAFAGLMSDDLNLIRARADFTEATGKIAPMEF